MISGQLDLRIPPVLRNPPNYLQIFSKGGGSYNSDPPVGEIFEFSGLESSEIPLNLIISEVQIALKMKGNDARG